MDDKFLNVFYVTNLSFAEERVPDYDLDAVQTSLSLQPNESYIDFYVCTQHLLNDYNLTYHNKTFVPNIKTMHTFLTELNCAPEYVPFLTSFYTQLMTHISDFGDICNRSYHLTFDIHKVFKTLQMMKAPLKPSTLRPSLARPFFPYLMLHQLRLLHQLTRSIRSSLIACLEVTIDKDFIQPTICAKITNHRDRCQACLLGFHHEVDCLPLRPLIPALCSSTMSQSIQSSKWFIPSS